MNSLLHTSLNFLSSNKDVMFREKEENSSKVGYIYTCAGGNMSVSVQLSDPLGE
jgi:hypothetical protein